MLQILVFGLVLFFLFYRSEKEGLSFLGFAIWVFITISLFSLGSFMCHRADIGIVKAQQKVISVYERNVNELNDRINSLKVDKIALLNHDSPVSSLTVAITQAMKQLSKAREIKAQSQVDIVKRSEGFFFFLVSEEDLELANK